MLAFSWFLISDGPKLSLVIGLDEYKGQKLTGNAVQFVANRRKLLNKMVDKLSNRFEADEELLSATSVADFTKWPAKFRDDLGNLVVLLACFFFPIIEHISYNIKVNYEM